MAEQNYQENQPKKQNFFKSTAFKSVAVLLIICLICGGLLAILNYVLYVPDNELFARKVKDIYNNPDAEFISTDNEDSKYHSLWDATKTNNGKGNVLGLTVAEVGEAPDAYIFDTQGFGGFREGSVTIYLAVNAKKPEAPGEPAVGDVLGWIVKTADMSQDRISQIMGSKQAKEWYKGESLSTPITNGQNQGDSYTVADVTGSSRAINNAVNAAGAYAREMDLVDDPSKGGVAKVEGLLVGTPYEDAEVKLSNETFSFVNVTGHQLEFVYDVIKEGKPKAYALMFEEVSNSPTIILDVSTLNDAERIIAKSSQVDSDIENAVASITFATNGAKIEKVVGDVYTVSQSSFAGSFICDVTIDSTGKITAIAIVRAGLEDIPQSELQTFLNTIVGRTNLDGISWSGWTTDPEGTGATISGNAARDTLQLALNHFNAQGGNA